MRKNLEARHCYLKTTSEGITYYAVYDGQSVRISKEIYDCLNESYSKERNLEVIERKHRAVSLDQLLEENSSSGGHSAISAQYQTISAEEAYFQDRQKKLESFVWDEINKLDPDERALILSYLEKNAAISELAAKECISDRAAYYRRIKVARDIGKKCRQKLEYDA